MMPEGSLASHIIDSLTSVGESVPAKVTTKGCSNFQMIKLVVNACGEGGTPHTWLSVMGSFQRP